jgi:hypothetical protein
VSLCGDVGDLLLLEGHVGAASGRYQCLVDVACGWVDMALGSETVCQDLGADRPEVMDAPCLPAAEC